MKQRNEEESNVDVVLLIFNLNSFKKVGACLQVHMPLSSHHHPQLQLGAKLMTRNGG